MSGAITAYAALAGAASFLQTILVQTPRSIGMVIPDCAIEERNLTRVAVTQHPVQVGAAISDHVYQMPPEVTLRWAWSNAGFGHGEGFVQAIYQSLLALQVPGILFTLTTGKNTYQNMVLTSLLVTTDKDTETALMVVAVCTQVIIVSTAAAQIPPASAQINPQQTASVTPTGAQTPAPVTQGSSQSASLIAQAAKSIGLTTFPGAGLAP
jgi:hypothetical protein